MGPTKQVMRLNQLGSSPIYKTQSTHKILPKTQTHRPSSLSMASTCPKTLVPVSSVHLIQNPSFTSTLHVASSFRFNSLTHSRLARPHASFATVRAAFDGNSSSRRSSSSGSGNEPRETIMLPGCDFNHWLIVMEFPKDPAPTREQMIETYLNTLATVLGRFASFFI